MWTATLLAAAVVLGSTAYGTWAFHCVALGAPVWPFVLGVPFAFLALPLAFTILWFTLAWCFGAPRPPNIRLTLRQRVVMFLREFFALARSVPRMIFYRWVMSAPLPAPAALPVVLLHGVGCNCGVWAGFRRHFAARGVHPIYALSYGPPLHSIEVFADQLAALIATALADTGAAQVILIGHSMGGLVARAYLRRYGATKVRRLVTIGTPHHGSMHAWLMVGTSLSQLRPGNPWLAQLNSDEKSLRDAGTLAAPTASIWSWHDSMVSPPSSSRIDWGENDILAGVAHNALLDDRGVWEQVEAQVRLAATSGSPA